MTPTVEFEVYLPKPVSGETLVAAVKEAAGKDFQSEGMIVGHGSSYPYDHCVVAVGQNFSTLMIKPEKSYSCFAVQDYKWHMSVYCVGYSNETLVKALQTFRDKVSTILAAGLGVTLDDIKKLTQERDGLAHGDAKYICNHCHVGATTNVGTCKQCNAPMANATSLW